jgi:ribosome biogenesis GTPase / thiamine phosphate phosphatase
MSRKRKKTQPRPVEANTQLGTVIRSVGSSSRVQTESGEQIDCVVRGKFRIQGVNSTNPVAVGDQVAFLPPEESSEMGVIVKVLPRKNYILRKAIAHARKVHILAANLDQAILLFTVAHPSTSTGFANRFLVSAEAYHIPVRIVINKVDLLQSEEERQRLAEVQALYRDIGYEVITLSALDEGYRDAVVRLLRDQVSFIGGHSGAGKSTLINLIDPSLDLKTAQVSAFNQKGRHTTTYAERHPLATGGYIIDSPGIKELGLTGFDKEDLSHYFPEMRRRLADCKFANCTHLREPGCAIKAALADGDIHPSRYDSYLRMLEEIEATNVR